MLEGWGAEEVSVPLVSYLRPDFEYVGAAPRKLGLALAFIVAGASGIAGFIADPGPDADPMTARALAPVETLSIAMNDAPVEVVREGPAIAAGQVGGPALLPLNLTIPIVVTPDGPDGAAKRTTAEPATDAAPVSAVVGSLTPADSAKKPRTRSSHIQRRDRNAYSRSRYSYPNYYQNGYARVW